MLKSILPDSQAEAPSSPQAEEPPCNQSATRTKRKKETVDYAEEKDSEDEALSDLSDGSEYLLEPEVLLEVDGESEEDESEVDFEEEESEEVLEEEKTGRKWADRLDNPIPSDAEEEDTEEVNMARGLGKELLRNEMMTRLTMQLEESPDIFIPDDRDRAYLAEFMVKPLVEQSSKWRRFKRRAQDWVKQMVMNGEMPTGKTVKAWADYAHTPAMYVSGLKALLGKYQEELRETMPETLQDGRLHLWALFEFKTDTSTPFPDIIDHLLSKIDSPSKQKFALAGFCQLIDSCAVFLSTARGKAQFLKKTHREHINFPTAEYDLDFRQHAMDLVDKEKNRLKLLKDTITKGKPYGKFQADVKFLADEKKKFLEDFEGEAIPAADVAIPKYMESEITRNFYKLLEDKASSGELVTGKEMVHLGRELIKRYVYHYN